MLDSTVLVCLLETVMHVCILYIPRSAIAMS